MNKILSPSVAVIIAASLLITTGLTTAEAAKQLTFDEKVDKIAQLEKKIDRITEKYQTAVANNNEKRINNLAAQLDNLNQRVADIRATIQLDITVPADITEEPVFYSGGTEVVSPQNITETQTSPHGKTVSYDVSVTSDDPKAFVICNPQSGLTFGIGTTTVTCTAIAPRADITTTSTFDVTILPVPNTEIHMYTERNSVSADTTTLNIKAFDNAEYVNFVYRASATSDASYEVGVDCDVPKNGALLPVGETTTITCTTTNGITRSLAVNVAESGATSPAFTPTVTLQSGNATIPWIESMSYTPANQDVDCWWSGVGKVTTTTTFPTGTTNIFCYASELGPRNADSGYYGLLRVTVE